MAAAALARSLSVFVDRTLSPAAQSRALATVARRELAAVIGSGRASPRYRRFVDGVEGVPEERVRPANGGTIVYRFSTLGSIATFALSFLVQRSPVRSGRYRRGFYVAVDGKLVPMARFNPDLVGADVAELAIGNVEPYSRKVDVQLAGGRRLKFSVPPGLFDDAASAIRSRFGALVEVKRVYTLDLPGQYRLRQEQTRKGSGSRKRQGTRVESPAIIIKPRR